MEEQQFLNSNIYPNLPKITESIIIHDRDYDEPKQEDYKSWRMKAILSQCFAAIAIFVINFSTTNFEFVITAYEQSTDANIWYTVWYKLIINVGLIAGGILGHIVGGRKIIILSGIALTASWLSIPWLSPEKTLVWVVYAEGLMSSMMQGPCYVYLAEIAQPHLRSSLMATAYLALLLGSRFHLYLTEMNVPLKAEPWINVMFPILGVTMIMFLPESPYWLANKGRYHEVGLSLEWFRGKPYAEIKSESTEIINNVQNSPSRSLRIPLLIIGIVLTFRSVIKVNYLERICSNLWLEQFELTDDKIILFLNILPVITFIVIAAFVGERMMILISLFGGSVALFSIFAFEYLHGNNMLDHCRWLCAVCTSIAVFFFRAGIVIIPLLLNAELFPSRLRNVGVGFGLVFMNIAFGSFLTDFFADYLAIFAFASMFGFILLFWLFPNNKDKSLVEIEQSSNSINDLRRKK